MDSKRRVGILSDNYLFLIFEFIGFLNHLTFNTCESHIPGCPDPYAKFVKKPCFQGFRPLDTGVRP